MTEKYFFDTDCLSAFLWVRGESILARVDTLKDNGYLSVESMESGSEEYNDYLRMTTSPEAGMRIIGRGEAAGIITEAEGNTIWSNMIRKRRMLPTTTFSEYLANYRKPEHHEMPSVYA